MPKPRTIERAYLQIIRWNDRGTINVEGAKYYVQFNPESLKVNFSNQISGQDNNGGSAIQFNSRGTTKLTFDLWFDVTATPAKNKTYTDVRQYTRDLVIFLQETRNAAGTSTVSGPPGCRFHWGTFLFEGIFDSVNENIEYFSEEGIPLRASMSVSISKQELKVIVPDQNASAANRNTAGTQPQQQAQEGDSVQSMSAREGKPENWKPRAVENGIENPLRINSGVSLSLE
jgi:hypothetical protein